ncbi:MAG: hypothetical protein GWP17_02250 [Aquificales bacterium]|nr:hypothetical protein [Aquificales bacterium]
MKQWAPKEVEFYKTYEAASKGNYDIYVVFVEKGLDLLNENGILGFILPHKFFNAKYGEPVRRLLSTGQHISDIVHFGHLQIFARASTYTCLLFLTQKDNPEFSFVKVQDLEKWRDLGAGQSGSIKESEATGKEWNFIVGEGANLYHRLVRMPVKFGDLANMFVGLQTSADTVFLFKDVVISNEKTTTVFSKQLKKEVEIESELLKPVVRSGKIGRYWANSTALVLFPYKLQKGAAVLLSESEMETVYPNAWQYLTANKTLLSQRERGKFAKTGWYQLYPKNLTLWEQPKIMMPYMIKKLSAFLDHSGSLYFVNVTTGGFGITYLGNEDSKYVVGLLNSKLLNWFMQQISTDFRGGYFAANKQFLVQLPIRTIDLSNIQDANKHDQVVSLVEKIADLHKRLATARLPQEKTILQRQLTATDRQIDQFVYQLYGLTDEEIGIVEA